MRCGEWDKWRAAQMIEVTRRPLVLHADPPTDTRPTYLIHYKGRTWEVEQQDMLDLYQLKGVSDALDL